MRLSRNKHSAVEAVGELVPAASGKLIYPILVANGAINE